MKKTLAQLKGDIERGVSVLCIKVREAKFQSGPQGENYGEPREIPVPERLKVMRMVSCKDTTGFYMKPLAEYADSGKGSFCGWPKASELDYQGDIFTIRDISHKGELMGERTYQLMK